MQTTTLSFLRLKLFITALLLSVLGQSAGADEWFDVWNNSDQWDVVGDAMVAANNPRQLVGKPGKGVLLNGTTGRAKSLVSKQTFQDVEVHIEFMVAKNSNSGVCFHGNHEIQILDSYGVKQPTAHDCGGIYPPAEGQPGTPSYRHIAGGSPSRVNAAKPPGEWQTMDIIFQAARFDRDGKKTSHARFVKIVHNGQVIQENVEAPWACGPNWDRKQFPRGSVSLQGDYGPVAFRNVSVRPWKAGTEALNAPPEGFTALFNGKDFTGWRLSPKAKAMWSIENGILKAPGLLKEWGADLATEKTYRDFVLMLEFRMPTITDSGINFRRLIPEIPGFGDQEQFNLRSKGGMGHLESYYFLPKETAKKMGLKEEEKPHVRHIDPEIGVWHTVKLTVKGRRFSAEFDGEVLYDNFQFHDWMMNMEPAPIRLQKHVFFDDDILGKMNPCPIEYRNIFIKELDPGVVVVPAKQRGRAAQRPNVIVLLSADLGWQDIGCYGGPAKTPTLDALAANGVRFTDFHAGAAVCSPSRATLLTGRQHMRTGVYHVLQDSMHNAHLLEREVTMAKVLKQAGYSTAHFGKWHLGLPTKNRNKPTPDKHGFDYWFATENNANPSHKNPVNFIRNGTPVGKIEGYSCQIVVTEAISWLDSRPKREEPFFLNIWFHEPHATTAAPDEIVSRYGKLDDPAAIYSGTIDNTDRAVARLVAKLKDMGVLENTLIIYSSDNGSYRKERNGGLRDSKGANFEGGIREPGIFYWPRGVAGGRVEHEPAGLVDVLPTICGLVGLDKPKGVHLDGADLAPLLTGHGDKVQRPQPLFWYLPTSSPAAAIRDGNYSLVAYRNYDLPQDHQAMAAVFKRIEEIVGKDDVKSGEGNLRGRIFNAQFENPEANRLRSQYVQLNTFQESWIPLIKAGGFNRFELYDLANDPAQRTNLSTRLPEVAARLKQKLLEINASVMADAPDWVSARVASPASPQPTSPNAELLSRIDRNNLPAGYDPRKHQEYVDRRMAGLNESQRAMIGQMWREKQRIDPNMKNRGASFVKIIEYVAANGKRRTTGQTTQQAR